MTRRARRRRFRPIPRPFAGRKLPRELRVGRVGRLAEALVDGVEGPGFEHLLRRIDQAPILGGNEVKLYFQGVEAFRDMREATRDARGEVLLESYIFKDDSIGRMFLKEAAGAAGRGVAVRMLADAIGSFSTRRRFWRDLEIHGIEVRLYNPIFPRLWYQPFRDHRKIFAVDRRMAFTGGMNIAEEYGSPRPRPGGNWRDTNVRVIGPAAWEMAVVFAEGWKKAGGAPFEIDPLRAEAGDAPGARILVLDSRPNRGQAESASVLAALAGAARRTLWITNAYFAPGHQAVEILGRAVERGVDVRLLLAGKTDLPIVRRAGHGYYSALLERGVRIWEYEAAILHAKSLVADGYVSVVGSTNLDFRSFLFNTECNLVILDRETAGGMERAFRDDLEASREIGREDWRRRTLRKKVEDRMARWLSPVL
jgi:cardiolipin synthase A/B